MEFHLFNVLMSTFISGSYVATARLAKSHKIAENSFKSRDNRPKGLLLRPSALTSVTNSVGSSTKSVLQPPKFHNPFTKINDEVKEDKETTSDTTNNKDESTGKVEKSENEEKDLEMDNKNENKEKKKEMPKFLALNKSPKEGENSINSSSVTASASAASFVFGQNLKERVAVAHDADSSDSSENEEAKEEQSNENGSSELMFSNAAAVCKNTNKDKAPGLTLSQAAHEMEEANRANKRKYSEVTLLTGEEDETNVLQINCKLFAYDKVSA